MSSAFLPEHFRYLLIPLTLTLLAAPCLAQTKKKPKKPSSSQASPKPSTQNRPIGVTIKGPVKVEFRQDTDAYFLVNTSRRIINATNETKLALDHEGFVPVGKDIVRTRRRGVVWKASKDGYQAVPGNIPVLTRINFFTQQFGDGTQEVVGGLVRTDGTLVNQEVSRYSVQSGYETIPFPWQNPNGSTTWMPFDRPLYESRTYVSNQLGAPVVPYMPFPIPATFESDSRFSILLEYPGYIDTRQTIQTIFRARTLYKVGDDKFASGDLSAANDLGPKVRGQMVINLSLGTLHSIDAAIGLSEGEFGQIKFGSWEFTVNAQRVAASKYSESGIAEFRRSSSVNSGTMPFDSGLVSSLLSKLGSFSFTFTETPPALLQPTSKLTLGADGSFDIKSEVHLSVGRWKIDGRQITLQSDTGKAIKFSIDLNTRTLKPVKGFTINEIVAFLAETAFPMSDSEISSYIQQNWRMGIWSDMPVDAVVVRSRGKDSKTGNYFVNLVVTWTGTVTGRNDDTVRAQLVKSNGSWKVVR